MSRDLKSDLFIDRERLDEEFIKQPELTEYYGRMLVEAEDQYEEKKAQFEVRFAQEMHEKKVGMELSGQKTTIKFVENLVMMDPMIDALRKEVRAAKKAKDLAKVAVKSISDRMSVLISVGASERQKNHTYDPSIRSPEYTPFRVSSSVHDMKLAK